MRRRIVHTFVLLVLAAGFLAAVIVLGQWAQDDLKDRERYALPFSEIHCTPPPGMGRTDFLEEVQYLASLPAQLSLLDDRLTERLREAFLRHPWVEKVGDVVVKPPRQVEVTLAYRTPVLKVRVRDEWRAVDAHGILLPKTTTDALPEYRGEASPPQGPAGTRWGDPRVEAAAAARRP